MKGNPLQRPPCPWNLGQLQIVAIKNISRRSRSLWLYTWSSAKYCRRIIQRYSLTPQLHPKGSERPFRSELFQWREIFSEKNHSPRQLLRLNKMAQFFLSFGQWSGKQEDCREPHCVTKIDQFRHSQSQKASTPATQTGGFQKRAITILQPTKTGEKKKLTAKGKRGFPIEEKQPVVLACSWQKSFKWYFKGKWNQSIFRQNR